MIRERDAERWGTSVRDTYPIGTSTAPSIEAMNPASPSTASSGVQLLSAFARRIAENQCRQLTVAAAESIASAVTFRGGL